MRVIERAMLDVHRKAPATSAHMCDLVRNRLKLRGNRSNPKASTIEQVLLDHANRREISRAISYGGGVSKPFPWLPLVGFFVFLLPGLVTWSFAEHEAMSFASDWVYICLPLLILAFVCLALVLRRWLDAKGLVAGGVVGAIAIGALMVVLSGSIGERVAYREQVQRLDDTEAFCRGEGVPQPDALAYAPGTSNTVVVFSGTERSLSREYGAGFLDWRPDTPRVDQTHLVGCVVESRTELETCQYTEGRMMHRVRVDRAVSLHALQTGQVVAQTVLVGGMPDTCHGIEEFYGSGDNTKTGTVPSDEDVLAYLRPHVGH